MIENQLPKPSRFRRWLVALKLGTYAGLIVAGSYCVVIACEQLCDYLGAQYAYARERVTEKLTTVHVVERVQLLDPEQVPVEQLIDQLSADAGLNPLILKAIALQESGGFARLDRYKHEAKLMGMTKNVRGTEDEKRLWSGSWGLLQVIPIIWQKPCQLRSYSDLIDPKTNIQCGITILKLNLERCAHIKQPGARLREALRMYNGSGPDAEAYADKVMQRLADMMILSLGESI